MKYLVILVSLFITSISYADVAVPNPPSQAPPAVNTPITFLGDDAGTWENVSNIFLNMKDGELRLEVSGYGGDVLTGLRTVQSMKDAESRGVKIHMEVVGPAYSMHAFLVCFGSDYVIKPGGTLMFHQIFGESTVLGITTVKNTALDLPFAVIQNFFLDTCISKGILTVKDKESILDGKEVYITTIGPNTLKVTRTPDEAWIQNIQDVINYIFVLCYYGLLLWAVVYIVKKAGSK